MSSKSAKMGLVDFSMTGSDLSYSVQLFADKSLPQAFLRQDRKHIAPSMAHAESTYVDYEKRKIHLRYEVKLTAGDYEARAGFLEITPARGIEGERMTGYWTSASNLKGSPARIGQLDFQRPLDDGDAP